MDITPIFGVVIRGKQLGRTIGYPTANVSLEPGIIDDGVYSLEIGVTGSKYSGIGTYRAHLELFEAHIFEFDQDIYDQSIDIRTIAKIRDNRDFPSLEAIRLQVQADCEDARQSSILPTLDTIVLETIQLFKNQKDLPKIDLTQFQTPLVVGSGNGYYTGRIIFRNLPAFFATESEIVEKLEKIPTITDVVVISASGEKHAPIILKAAKVYQKHTVLISSSEKSSGRELADASVVMPKIPEPYTYNTSTYFGYMLAENPELDLQGIGDFIQGTLKESLEKIDFGDYQSFCIVIPDQFVLIREMFETKFIELFGRKIARDVFSYEQMKHATTVVQDTNELFICFDNTIDIRYGVNQVNLPIFDGESYAAMMLVGYYVIGKIQVAFPPYFMASIAEYCQRAKDLNGFNISPMVPK